MRSTPSILRSSGSARGRGRRRVHVEVVDGRFDFGAGRDAPRPLHEVRYVDPAFEERDLPAAEGPVDLGKSDITCSAVVRGEEHDRVLVESVAFEGPERGPLGPPCRNA